MLCATYDAEGVISIVLPAPADITTCALLIQTPAESANNPFMFSAEDGAAIAYAVVGVWCVGFAGRALIRSLALSGDSSNVQENW